MESALTRRRCLAACAALAVGALARARVTSRRSALDLRGATALDLAAGLRAGQWSAGEITEDYLSRIEALNGALGRFEDNGALNAFIRTYPDLARRSAQHADQTRSYAGWSGIPVALKDVFAVAGFPVTVGTPAFQRYRAAHDCALWRKWREAGAVLLGHTQAQRFISGITTPQTANPWNRQLIVGGSSGGSAAAVAAGLTPVALGTETAGSLIYPAACCAVTTLKPSHGLLSLKGVFPGLPSFDVAGPLARSAADCAWVMSTLAGGDAEDACTVEPSGQALPWPDTPTPTATDERPLRGLRFLVSTHERYEDRVTRRGPGDPGQLVSVDPRIQQCFESFLRSLTTLGAELIVTEIPQELGRYGSFRTLKDARLGNRCAREVLAAADEWSVSLPARYRWLEHASEAERAIAVAWYGGSGNRLESDELLAAAAILNPQTLRIAQAAREALRAAWGQLLDRHHCDAHVYLEIGSPLPVRRGLEDTPMPRARRTGVEPNDLGWPVLSLPVGTADGLDVPVSAQLLARRWHDPRLLSWGMAWQRCYPQSGFVAPAVVGRPGVSAHS